MTVKTEIFPNGKIRNTIIGSLPPTNDRRLVINRHNTLGVYVAIHSSSGGILSNLFISHEDWLTLLSQYPEDIAEILGYRPDEH